MNTHGRVNELRDAALDYAARGWPVLPVQPRGKAPLTAHGLHDATTDPDTLHGWWDRRPNANVGLRSGVAFHALDVDAHHGGFDTLARLTLVEHEKLASGPCVLTPSGGFHLYFAPPSRPIGNRAGFVAGCDWRGEGGYVVAPPSIGANGSAYIFDPYYDSTTPLEAPDAWLVDLLDPPRPHPQATTRPRTVGSAYARAALTEECRIVAGAPAGARNDTLVRAAFSIGQLIAEGVLDATEAAGYLLGAALASGLPETEARRTLGSGLQAGADNPRRVP